MKKRTTERMNKMKKKMKRKFKKEVKRRGVGIVFSMKDLREREKEEFEEVKKGKNGLEKETF